MANSLMTSLSVVLSTWTSCRVSVVGHECFWFRESVKQQGFVAFIVQFQDGERECVWFQACSVLKKKTPAWFSVSVPSDVTSSVTSDGVFRVCVCMLKHTVPTLLLRSVSASVELVVDAEVRPGDIIGVEEDGYGFPRVLGDQLL